MKSQRSNISHFIYSKSTKALNFLNLRFTVSMAFIIQRLKCWTVMTPLQTWNYFYIICLYYLYFLHLFAPLTQQMTTLEWLSSSHSTDPVSYVQPGFHSDYNSHLSHVYQVGGMKTISSLQQWSCRIVVYFLVWRHGKHNMSRWLQHPFRLI